MDAVIFDLDGTLWDTCAACAVAWNRVLARNGIPYRTIEAQDIRAVTGLPHAQCIEEVFVDLDPAQREIVCHQTMEEDNRVVRELGGEPYPGIRDGLESLADIFRLGIVSNCQSGYIETFLDCMSMHEFFCDFECWGNTGKSKGENLQALIQRNDFSEAVFIVDTRGDQEAAHYCGIPFIQVTYGFGEELRNADRFPGFPALTEHLLEVCS